MNERDRAIREVIMFLSSQLAVAFRPERERMLNLAQQHQLTAADLIQYRVDRFLRAAAPAGPDDEL